MLVADSFDVRSACKYARHMATMIQIRNVPPKLHRRLKARAALEGMSLSDYLLCQVRLAEANHRGNEGTAGRAFVGSAASLARRRGQSREGAPVIVVDASVVQLTGDPYHSSPSTAFLSRCPSSRPMPRSEAAAYTGSMASRNRTLPRQKGKLPRRLGKAAATGGVLTSP